MTILRREGAAIREMCGVKIMDRNIMELMNMLALLRVEDKKSPWI